MLVLTRLKNQSIVVGNDITITVLDVDGERVRIGIDAPRSLRIMRAEILDEVKEANLAAVQANKSLLAKMSQSPIHRTDPVEETKED